MKKLIWFAIVIIALVTTSCQEKTDVEKEKAEINAAIENFMNDRSELNYEGWINAWTDDPSSFLSWSWNDGHTFILLDDWKKNGKNEYDQLIQEQKEGAYSVIIEPLDITIQVYQDAAWAHFNINWNKVFEEDNKTEELMTSFTILTFVKQDGEWKISSLSSALTSFYEETVSLEEIIEKEETE